MGQPTAIDTTSSQISGSLELANSSVEYVTDGRGKDYPNNYQGLNWMPAVPENGSVIFIGNSSNVGIGPGSIPLFWRSSTSSSSDVLEIANGLPNSPRNFTDTGSAYSWSLANEFFVKNKPFGGFYTNNLVTYIDPGLIGSYPTTGIGIYDLSGNSGGGGGSLNNSPTYNSLGWLDLDGTNENISLSANSFRNTPTPGTIEAVFNIKDYTNSQVIVGTTENRDRIISIVDGGQIRGCQFNGDLGLFCGGQYRPEPKDKFHHVALTYTVDNGQGTSEYALWVDGEKRAEQTPVVTTTVGNDNNANVFGGTTFNFTDGGGSRNNFGGTNDSTGFFSGSLERFLIHNAFLTDAQILQNYYQAPIVTDGLQFAVDPFNICSYPRYGTTTFSLSGSKSGSMLNGVDWLLDNGGVFNFDGVDDIIEFSNSFPEVYELFTEPNKPFSVDTWSNTVGSGDYTIVGKSGGWGGSATFVIGVAGGSGGFTRIWTVIRGSASSTSYIVPQGKWRNITLTWDGTTAKIYFNGTYIRDLVVGGVANQNYNMYIGGSSSNGLYRTMNGQIGPVLFYNKALSQGEIVQNYTSLVSRFNV